MPTKDPETTWETINVKLAKEYMACNTGNRKLSNVLVERNARDLANDDWEQTHEGIAFDEDGNLIDGQHRLAAIILVGKSIRCLVTRGLKAQVRDKINIGKRRTTADILYSEGYKHRHHALGATARAVLNLERINNGTNPPKQLGWITIPPHEIHDFVKQNEARLQEAVTLTRNKDARMIFASPAMFAALYLLCAQRSSGKAHEFFSSLVSGDDLSRTDPIYRLRQQLLVDRTDKRKRRKAHITLAMAIKAWNAWLHGEEMRKLNFSDSEKWPTIGRRRPRRVPGKTAAAKKRSSKKNIK